jgi:hypothetical protein
MPNFGPIYYSTLYISTVQSVGWLDIHFTIRTSCERAAPFAKKNGAAQHHVLRSLISLHNEHLVYIYIKDRKFNPSLWRVFTLPDTDILIAKVMASLWHWVADVVHHDFICAQNAHMHDKNHVTQTSVLQGITVPISWAFCQIPVKVHSILGIRPVSDALIVKLFTLIHFTTRKSLTFPVGPN